MKIGLDIGGSSIKIVVVNNSLVLHKSIIRNVNYDNELDDCIQAYLSDWNIETTSIKAIYITGAGASYITRDIIDINTIVMPEYESTCKGALLLSGLNSGLVVSMGTGTAFYDVTDGKVNHLIGSGVGGGTLSGLSLLLLNESSVTESDSLAMTGVPATVDLTIGDISKVDMPGLPKDITASNFGKCSVTSEEKDIASGLFNMVYQSIGTMSVLASRMSGKNDIILTGQVSQLRSCRRVLSDFENFYGVRYIIPDHSEFATAIGACSDSIA